VRKAFELQELAAYVIYEAPTIEAMARYLQSNRQEMEVGERHERGEKRREQLEQRRQGLARKR
jgi:hypothetical protein